ncbi:hypothetical protein NSQ77_11090 [Oceanobacillus sp. FSL K6-2867]|uniref:hypothetical protein n=1 Tax=Oceanobacillus sp. FSL K6-2867 TaxID=2954748 RepID=UPI0030DA2FF7
MKRNPEELLEEISDFLVVYLKSGQIQLNSFINKTDLPVSRMEQLLKIHFLLQKEVKSFVKDLPKLIRRFKTSTTVNQDSYRGQIRGQIHWEKTITERLKINYQDKTMFSVNERGREYGIKENLVLLETIQTLYFILFLEINSDYFEKYAWFKEWTELKKTISKMLHKNIYLSRVKKHSTHVTERMILDTIKHRNPLYREAATILQQYRKIMAGEMVEEEIRTLLKETFVRPQEEDVLFELYWVVKLLEQNTNNAKLELMDGRNNQVAEWHDERFYYKLYHDSGGSDEVQFSIKTDEVSGLEHPFISRRLRSMEEAYVYAHMFFQKSFDMSTYWRGRPDILVEVYDVQTNKLVKVIIGEVKYTSRVDYAITGLRELTDYTKLLQDKRGSYLADEIEVNGMLFTSRIAGMEPLDNNLSIYDGQEEIKWCAY